MAVRRAPTRSLRRPSQAERSAAMRERLVRAAIASLIESGYAGTTAVAVCARAGVTRGAFHHHFPGLAALLGASLETLYADLVRIEASGVRAGAVAESPLERMVGLTFAATRRREFKAVIEIWLAARNEPTLGADLAPRIEKLADLFSPERSPRLASKLGRSARAADFYRLVMEAMIGMALGRAVSPGDRPLAHEGRVVELLRSIARTV